MKAENLEKMGNYEQMEKQVSNKAKRIGIRKPVYVNYDKTGRYIKPEKGQIWEHQRA